MQLYHCIAQRDLVLPAKCKQTHYFDWRCNREVPGCASPDGALQYLDFYSNVFDKSLLLKCSSILTGETAPSYMLGDRVVIQRMEQVITNCRKILAILCDPVDPAYSHYCNTTDTEVSPQQLCNGGHHHLDDRSFK
jgi:hypothetical protein